MQPLAHLVGRPVRGARQEPVETRHAQQRQADDQHAGDRAAAERNRERRCEAAARGFRRAHVGAHRHVHADVAGEPGQDRAEREAARGARTQRPPDDDEQDDADDADRRVLAVEVRLGAGLDGGGDFLHAWIAGGLGEDPVDPDDAEDDRHHRADEREDEACGHGLVLPKKCELQWNAAALAGPHLFNYAFRDSRPDMQ